MSLSLTPEMVEAAYELLRVTPPFIRWNLPEGEDIKFRITRATDCFARYWWDGTRHTISVSNRSVAYLSTLTEKVAHEMIHLYLEELNMDRRGSQNTHSLAFRKLAAQVCKQHGFDPKAFY